MPSTCRQCQKNPKVPGRGQSHCLECKANRDCPDCGTPMKLRGDRVVGGRTYQGWTCLPCSARRSMEKYQRNADLYNASRNAKRYGISVEQYQGLINRGICDSCGYQPSGLRHEARLHVDHDHGSGKIRGVLCGKCNRALGLLGDDPRKIQNLWAYLSKQ